MDIDSNVMLVLCSFAQLIRELGNINVKKKEPPFCYPYSLKARVLLLAHLARMDVSENIEEGMNSHSPQVSIFNPVGQLNANYLSNAIHLTYPFTKAFKKYIASM